MTHELICGNPAYSLFMTTVHGMKPEQRLSDAGPMLLRIDDFSFNLQTIPL